MHTALNVIHVSGAILWGGGALFVALFVSPAALKAGEGAGPFMGALAAGPLADVMTGVSLLTVGSGIWLWAIVYGGSFPSTFGGGARTVGAIAGIVALSIALFRQRPIVKGIQELAIDMAATDGPPSADQLARLGALRGRMLATGNLLAVVVGIAIIGMTLGG